MIPIHYREWHWEWVYFMIPLPGSHCLIGPAWAPRMSKPSKVWSMYIGSRNYLPLQGIWWKSLDPVVSNMDLVAENWPRIDNGEGFWTVPCWHQPAPSARVVNLYHLPETPKPTWKPTRREDLIGTFHIFAAQSISLKIALAWHAAGCISLRCRTGITAMQSQYQLQYSFFTNRTPPPQNTSFNLKADSSRNITNAFRIFLNLNREAGGIWG